MLKKMQDFKQTFGSIFTTQKEKQTIQYNNIKISTEYFAKSYAFSIILKLWSIKQINYINWTNIMSIIFIRKFSFKISAGLFREN